MKSATNPGRVAGILYLLLAVFGPFGLVIMPTMLIVNGDAAATASNILASEGMFRLAIVSGVMVALVEIGLVVVLYQLLRPVNQTLSLIAAFSRLVMAVVQAINLLNYFAVLLLLSGADYLNVFEPDQINASVLLFLNLHSVAANLWQIFFGLHLLILGYLIFRSGYIPRILGILLLIAASGYLISSFGNVVFPDYHATFTQIILVFTVIPELALMAWLLVKGAQPSDVAHAPLSNAATAGATA